MFRMSAGLAVLGLLVGLASAQPQNYAQRGTQIRAGIALLDSAQTAGVPSNPTPFVWYNLDANRSVKPAGWNIFNPNAPSQATQAISNRWTLIAGVVGGGSPGVGERITKRNAAYWEVQISQATESQMANYDVLLINASGNINLNTIERERLRNFVDRGGVLWVETANTNATFNTLYSINNFPLPFSVVPGGAGLGNLDIFHPVLSYPYTFNISNLDYLNNGGVGPVLNQATSVGAAAALNQSITADWFKLKPVVLQNGAASMMVGRLGDGFMVVTTRSAANYVNQVRTPTGYFANNQYYAGEVRGGFDKGSDVLGKLAVNMISLGSGSEQPSNGSRKSGSSPIDIGAPLLKRFDADINGLDFGPKNQFPAAAYKGLAVVSANDRIYVYDANPKSDIDGNGNPDDGVPDYSLGNNLDLIWSSNALAGPISAPTCAEVAQPAAGVPSDQIMVTLADGTVAVFDAFAGNPAPAYSVAPPSIVSGVNTAELNHGPYAPTIHESRTLLGANIPGNAETLLSDRARRLR